MRRGVIWLFLLMFFSYFAYGQITDELYFVRKVKRILKTANFEGIDKANQVDDIYVFRTRPNQVFVFAFTNDIYNNCHACMPYVSAFVFKKEGGEWHLVADKVGFDKIGSYGKGPEKDKLFFYPFGSDGVVFYFEDGYMAQGFWTSWLNLLVYDGRDISKFQQVYIAEDDSGMISPMGTSWKSEYLFQTDADGFPVLVLQIEGKKEDKDISGTEKYVYDSKLLKFVKE